MNAMFTLEDVRLSGDAVHCMVPVTASQLISITSASQHDSLLSRNAAHVDS